MNRSGYDAARHGLLQDAGAECIPCSLARNLMAVAWEVPNLANT